MEVRVRYIRIVYRFAAERSPIGIERAHYNYKRDGEGVFLVPHRRMLLFRPLLIYLSIEQAAGAIVNLTDVPPPQCCAVRSSTNPGEARMLRLPDGGSSYL